ncbi:MAG: SIMPL domain-containing protein [Capnocytophaga sp.]|nr:SIMPL domain-containing protein [Capnocytophaga sp.]
MKPYVILFSLTASVLSAQQVPSVNVIGEGVVYAQPDVINIGLSIEDESTDVQYLKQKNGESAAKVIQVLMNMLPADSYKTERVNLYKNYDYNTKEYKYTATQSIRIKLEDLSKYEPLMEAIFEAGVNRIDYVNFDLKEETKKPLLKQARTQAMDDARQKALLYAVSVEQNIGKAIQISEVGASAPPVMYREDAMMKSSALGASNRQTLAVGVISVEANINVSFELLKGEATGN